MDEQRLKIIVSLAECYRTKTTEDLLRGYARSLADIPLASLQEAADEALKRCRFFPSIAELREMAPGSAPAPLRVIDGETVYSCPICQDSGLVLIWQPRITDMIRIGDLWPTDHMERIKVNDRETRHPELTRHNISRAECVVACNCEPGQRRASQKRRGKSAHVRFNPSVHCRYGPESDLRAWAIRHGAGA